MLEVANCDWRMLQQIEKLLRSLSTELVRAMATQPVGAWHVSEERRGASDLHSLQRSLTWVRQHEYEALESDLHHRLESALESALGTLDRLERSQQETWSPCPRSVEAGGGR